MSAQITETTGRDGVVKVNVNCDGKRAQFSSLHEATNWLCDLKRYENEFISVFLRQIVLTARKELKYESCYAL